MLYMMDRIFDFYYARFFSFSGYNPNLRGPNIYNGLSILSRADFDFNYMRKEVYGSLTTWVP